MLILPVLTGYLLCIRFSAGWGDTEMRKPSLPGVYSQLGSQILNGDHPVRRGHERGKKHTCVLRERMQKTRQVRESDVCEEVLQEEERGLSTDPRAGVGPER